MNKAFRDDLFNQVMNRLSPDIDQFILEKVRESDEYKDTVAARKYTINELLSRKVYSNEHRRIILQKFPNACFDSFGDFADFTKVNPLTLKVAASMMVENDKD